VHELTCGLHGSLKLHGCYRNILVYGNDIFASQLYFFIKQFAHDLTHICIMTNLINRFWMKQYRIMYNMSSSLRHQVLHMSHRKITVWIGKVPFPSLLQGERQHPITSNMYHPHCRKIFWLIHGLSGRGYFIEWIGDSLVIIIDRSMVASVLNQLIIYYIDKINERYFRLLLMDGWMILQLLHKDILSTSC
jgi:hypothetical protein